MQYDPIALLQASQAQKRYFDAARVGGPVETRPSRHPFRSSLAAALDRAASAVAPRGHRTATRRSAAA